MEKFIQEADREPRFLLEEDQKIVDDLISRLGPDDLWNISLQLQRSVMDDINSAMQQAEEDNAKELSWVRTH